MSRPTAIAALLVLLLAGCAGRGERAERPAQEPAPEAVAEPLPDPALAPLRCAADEDCRLTQLPRPVAEVVDCYCPECPRPLRSEVAAAHEAAWQRLCAGDWEAARRCLAPMCPPPPGVLACVEGRCGYAPVP